MNMLTIAKNGHKYFGKEFRPTGDINAGKPVEGIILAVGRPEELMATFAPEELTVEPATLGNNSPMDLPASLATELDETVEAIEGWAQDLLAELGWDDVDWCDSRTGEIHPGLARRMRTAHAQRVEDAMNGDDSCRRGDENDW